MSMSGLLSVVVVTFVAVVFSCHPDPLKFERCYITKVITKSVLSLASANCKRGPVIDQRSLWAYS